MNNSLSIFANALASENISFSFDKEADTASFDVKSRHLIMPVWDVSETVQTMLIAHEISHALWTPYERSEELLNAAEAQGYHRGLLQRIANVVEDVRIEKMMKAKFPGTRRDFYLGYKEIVDKDLFGFANMDISNAGIVNRMNLHFKWGVPGFLPVTLSATEQIVADMVDSVKTFEDTIEVAKRLYEHPDMQETVQKVMDAANGQGKGEEDVEQILDGEVKENKVPGVDEKKGEYMHFSSVIIGNQDDYTKNVISTDEVRKFFQENPANDPAAYTLSLTKYREFVRESDGFVRQLVAQFERKKAADEIRRERPKQTGMLNLDRLHQYRTHDDIFLSKIIKQDGKNHGIVFMLDLSGSMSHVIGDCLLQVLQLVWFCEKAKIPFEVFGFTDIHASTLNRKAYDEGLKQHLANGGDYNNYEYNRLCRNAKDSPNAIQLQNARLVQLASSKDSAADREMLLAMLYSAYVTRDVHGGCARPEQLQLGGTPTVECLSLASHFMVDWVKANNIQIPTIMVVTDGQPNGVEVRDHGKAQLFYHTTTGTMTVTNEVLETVHRYDMTANQFVSLPNAILATMLQSLREKLNARCIGMFVGDNRLSERDFLQFCVSNSERKKLYNRGYLRDSISKSSRFLAAKETYKDGCILVHGDIFPGYDAFFLTKTPKVVRDEDAIATTGTFTKVKNTFIKTMANRRGSRVFLTHYVDIVAGQPVKKTVDTVYSIPI